MQLAKQTMRNFHTKVEGRDPVLVNGEWHHYDGLWERNSRGQICVDETLDCTDTVSSIFKIGKDSCDCDSDQHTGALKFVDGQLRVCLGNRWAKAQWKPKVDDAYGYGTEFYPGKSCKDIKKNLTGSPADGIYWIKSFSADKGFPVYCDMEGGGWTLAMKFISGIPDMHGLSTYFSELPIAEFVEKAISVTNEYKGHYKNRLAIWRYCCLPKKSASQKTYSKDTKVLADEFNQFFASVKVGLYSSSGTPLLKPPLIFKLTKSSRSTDFFRKENLEQSPWDDLMEIKNPVAFRTDSSLCWRVPLHCRLFEVMKTFGDDQSAASEKRCDGDFGWLMLTAPDNRICPFEKKRGRQSVFLYSKGKASVKFNDENAVGVADMMAIFVQ
ncbi:hypothetical protein P5673_008501 [Acropora cervicornis]|uniref:Fibrinogen C-terminal domain-containing protein n=1 Tax=Acropora cervicornis TaxID=6130 RepID=A0AAD9VAS6_ACRCE|nr:hypothetical protein P5673_008501 [Acropora cervicornis]